MMKAATSPLQRRQCQVRHDGAAKLLVVGLPTVVATSRYLRLQNPLHVMR
jgi:hypothetical protein